ncbi:MAG: hypothetical protein LBQ78_09305 [Tannerellaceae bacterium]|jgi:hypothetical protein|nr:hypothetical protein [Tannerellaceae bacterium]
MKTIRKITLLLFSLSFLSHLPAQVTIGMNEASAEGALLQLKDIVAAAGNPNASKGLLMPRVRLVSQTELTPMFPTATAGEMREHAGLIVYNLTENDNLKKGVMVWNGEVWNHIKTKEINNNLDTEIKKTLYTNAGAIDANSVKLGSIEATLRNDGGNTYFAHPNLRLAAAGMKTFHYQIGQYWDGNDDSNGYSYDANNISFTSTYQHLAYGSQIVPSERNEVWMFEEGSTDIIHIQFITLGKNTASNIYAVLVERF